METTIKWKLLNLNNLRASLLNSGQWEVDGECSGRAFHNHAGGRWIPSCMVVSIKHTPNILHSPP